MNFSKDCLGMSVDFVAVKSRSEFPDLLPFEKKVVRPLQRRVKLVLAMFGASCRVCLSSLPQFDFCVFVVMMILATA